MSELWVLVVCMVGGVAECMAERARQSVCGRVCVAELPLSGGGPRFNASRRNNCDRHPHHCGLRRRRPKLGQSVTLAVSRGFKSANVV